MKAKLLIATITSSILFTISTSTTAAPSAAPNNPVDIATEKSGNIMDELNPFDKNIENILKDMDAKYYEETGESPFAIDWDALQINLEPSCFQLGCEVYAQVVKSEQRLYLYIHGVLQDSWLVSTGTRSHETPLLNMHPNGRIYDKYSSSAYPGGDYNGLGNMPYAVFIKGGFALHGTVKANWSKLGTKASHGCVRMHPDNGQRINRLIRAAGVRNSWISIQN